MSEDFPNSQIDAAAKRIINGNEVQWTQEPEIQKLHHRAIEINTTQQLIDQAEALRANGINGNILCLIGLPASSPHEKGKEIALVDFGDIKPEGRHPVLVITIDGQPVPIGHIVGYAESRFGLLAFNYKASDHIGTYVPIKNEAKTFGREHTYDNHMLGIETSQGDNDHISRSHFSIYISPTGTLTLEDHSTNGTTITKPKSTLQ